MRTALVVVACLAAGCSSSSSSSSSGGSSSSGSSGGSSGSGGSTNTFTGPLGFAAQGSGVALDDTTDIAFTDAPWTCPQLVNEAAAAQRVPGVHRIDIFMENGFNLHPGAYPVADDLRALIDGGYCGDCANIYVSERLPDGGTDYVANSVSGTVVLTEADVDGYAGSIDVELDSQGGPLKGSFSIQDCGVEQPPDGGW